MNTVRRMIHGKNNMVRHKKALLSSVIFDIRGDGNEIAVGAGCVLDNVTFHLRGSNHRISIENHCVFNCGGTIWIEDSDCVLSIGERSTFEDVDLALTEPGSEIAIGRDCLFSYDIDVRTGDSHSIIAHASNERVYYAEDVHIGDHVWIAAHSIILKGSSLPDNSVVAAGSVVTRRFETRGVVVGGNPARQLQDGITWSRERIYRAGQRAPGSDSDSALLDSLR